MNLIMYSVHGMVERWDHIVQNIVRPCPLFHISSATFQFLSDISDIYLNFLRELIFEVGNLKLFVKFDFRILDLD